MKIDLIVRSLVEDCGLEASAHYPDGIEIAVDKGHYIFGTVNGPWQGDYIEATRPGEVSHVLTLQIDPARAPQDIAAAIAASLTVGWPHGEGVER